MRNPGTASDPSAQAIERQSTAWRERLLDMSRGNRLLFFKPTRSSTIEIAHPPFLDLFDRLVTNGETLSFPLLSESDLLLEADQRAEAESSSRNYRPNEIGARQTDRQVARALYNLRSRARTAREEQGINVLYLAFGFLVWKEVDYADLVQSPLILVPVDLTRETSRRPYQLSLLEEDIVVNPVLEAKLQQDFAVELPELPDDLDTGGLEQYLQGIRSGVGSEAGWQITDEAVLGIFTFQSRIIISDLERHHSLLAKHPLIRRLADPARNAPTQIPELITADQLDDRIAPLNTFQVLDADSSQQEVIAAARMGLSFIVQGPPGTGKSQTIANIIAEFLAEGRRVLFVSEKMAALEVVYRRLSQVGLGDYCLEVHSYRRNKKEVIEELGQSLKASSVSAPAHVEDRLNSLQASRRRLNEYVRALHSPRFLLGMSAFQAYGALALCLDLPVLSFGVDDPTQVTGEMYQERLRVIDQIAALSDVVSDYDHHPWRGCRIETLTLQLQAKIPKALQYLRTAAQGLQEQSAHVAALYNVRAPATVEEAERLVNLGQTFTPAVLKLPLQAICERFEEYQNLNPFVLKLRPQYRQDTTTLHDVSLARLPEDAKRVLQQLRLAERIQGQLRERAGSGRLASKQEQLAVVATADKYLDRIHRAAQFLADQVFADLRPDPLANYEQSDFDTLIAWSQRQEQCLDQLESWVAFNGLAQRTTELGLDRFVHEALTRRLKPPYWKGAFLRKFLMLYIDAIEQSAPVLRGFQGLEHKQLIDQFRDLDREQIALARHRIAARLSQSRPRAEWMAAPTAETSILQRELNKQRRLKSLRRLFAEIPKLILNLRPCLMMSPLTVSQLLDPQLFQFDLVVFDEASQIPSEHAVGAIIRGKQAIVVGDKQQLPPTRFFESLETFDDEDSEDEPDTFESILNECDAADLPSKMLLWHYRSCDESLIAFSNHFFYGNRLTTFPSPHRAGERDTGSRFIDFVYVQDGVYRRGAGERHNLVEAQAVVELVADHFRRSPALTLGVVTFSQAQQQAIELLLERAVRDDPVLQALCIDSGPEPLFVKNLEQVQGDERDVIVFSVGYGRDETGRFILNFGPLNRAGGDRRLNVAVTRARQRVRVVASIEPEDIDLARTSSRGAALLRSYLLVARDGVKALYAATEVDIGADFGSPFEEAVYQALTAEGLRLDKQVGIAGYRIDLAVVDPDMPGRYLLGIECDGATYHSSVTARDRDRLRQQVLEGLGWRIHRIWSRSWVTNRSREIGRVVQAVDDIRQEMKRHAQAEEPRAFQRPADAVEPGPPAQESGPSLPPWATLYRKAELSNQGDGIQSFHGAHQSELIEAICAVVDVEGPIEADLALKRVAEGWGVKRRGQLIQKTFRAAVKKAAGQNRLVMRGDFLWPASLGRAPVRVPAQNDEPRTIAQIPVEELTECAYLLTKDALSIEKSDLVQQTAQLFGLRATSAAKQRIGEAIELLKQSGQLQEIGGKVQLVEGE